MERSSFSRLVIANAVVLGLLAITPALAEMKVVIKRFGAYALSDTKHLGWAYNQPTEREAVDGAIRSCGGAAKGCKVVMKAEANCVAYAESFSNGYWIGTAGADNLETARKMALDFCGENAAQKTCKL